MTSIHYDPYLGRIQVEYLGRIQGTVESSKKTFIVNYVIIVKVSYQFHSSHGAALPDSNLQRSLAQ